MATMDITHLNKDSPNQFCAQCLDDIPTVAKATAYCKQCKEFICSDTCLRQHAKFRLSKSHGYLMDSDLVNFLQLKGLSEPDVNNGFNSTEDGNNAIKYTVATHRTEYNIRSALDREICSINACVVLDNDDIVLSDLKNSNLKLYDISSRTCKSVLKFDKLPRDICLSSLNRTRLFATETGVRGIHCVEASNNELKIIDTLNTDSECFGLTCWKNGLAVTMSVKTSFYGQFELRLLDYFGRVKRIFNSKKTPGCNLSMPWYLCSNVDGQRVFVSDFGNSTVTCFDVDNGIVFTYNDPETLIRPVSMATNNDGDTFVVSQRGHCVHQLSSKGTRKGVKLSQDLLEFPGGIAITSNEASCQIILQCIGWSDKIQVFDITNTTIVPKEAD